MHAQEYIPGTKTCACMIYIFENISMIALITLHNRSKFKNSHLMDVCKLKPFKLKIEIL